MGSGSARWAPVVPSAMAAIAIFVLGRFREKVTRERPLEEPGITRIRTYKRMFVVSALMSIALGLASQIAWAIFFGGWCCILMIQLWRASRHG